MRRSTLAAPGAHGSIRAGRAGCANLVRIVNLDILVKNANALSFAATNKQDQARNAMAASILIASRWPPPAPLRALLLRPMEANRIQKGIPSIAAMSRRRSLRRAVTPSVRARFLAQGTPAIPPQKAQPALRESSAMAASASPSPTPETAAGAGLPPARDRAAVRSPVLRMIALQERSA